MVAASTGDHIPRSNKPGVLPMQLSQRKGLCLQAPNSPTAEGQHPNRHQSMRVWNTVRCYGKFLRKGMFCEAENGCHLKM